MAHLRYKSCISIQHTCGLPAAPTPCADVTQLRMLDFNAGKGRQIMKCIHAATAQSGVLLYYTPIAEECAGYVL